MGDDANRPVGHTPTTTADTWDREWMDDETALELADALRDLGYEVRLAVEASRGDSNVIKTVDNQQDAEATLQNIRELNGDAEGAGRDGGGADE